MGLAAVNKRIIMPFFPKRASSNVSSELFSPSFSWGNRFREINKSPLSYLDSNPDLLLLDRVLNEYAVIITNLISLRGSCVRNFNYGFLTYAMRITTDLPIKLNRIDITITALFSTTTHNCTNQDQVLQGLEEGWDFILHVLRGIIQVQIPNRGQVLCVSVQGTEKHFSFLKDHS